jgi:hypothetical protein
MIGEYMYEASIYCEGFALLGNGADGSVNTFPSITLSTIEGRPLLGSGSLNTFSQQRINTNHR